MTDTMTKPPAAPAPKPPVLPKDEVKPGIWFNRRDFLSFAGWWAFFGFFITMFIGTLRFMFPRVLFEPPTSFRAGSPGEYPVGVVSEKYKDKYRVWIIRDEEGFYALLAICTHLGCTPRWLDPEQKFKCPCHGSGYYKNGVNFEGPTPRPLERIKITLSEDGQLLIDKNTKFLYEKGEWAKAGAFLKYS